MKALLLLALSTISPAALSASVNITSFNLVRIDDSLDHPVAELCGKVNGSEETINYIKVLVDKGARRPGHYNTITDDNGNFCLTIVTYRGQAEVSLIGQKETVVGILNSNTKN